jgi:hypothetical protein
LGRAERRKRSDNIKGTPYSHQLYKTYFLHQENYLSTLQSLTQNKTLEIGTIPKTKAKFTHQASSSNVNNSNVSKKGIKQFGVETGRTEFCTVQPVQQHGPNSLNHTNAI